MSIQKVMKSVQISEAVAAVAATSNIWNKLQQATGVCSFRVVEYAGSEVKIHHNVTSFQGKKHNKWFGAGSYPPKFPKHFRDVQVGGMWSFIHPDCT